MGMGIKKWRGARMETIYLGRTNSEEVSHQKDDAKQKWQMFWRRISREKKTFISKTTPDAFKASYDPQEYSQNFDQGSGWEEQDNLYRSFSARYADPSRILQKNNVRYGKELV